MARKPSFDYDVIVIGSGAGGSPAASILARTGKKVAIIEQGAFGGESPNWGDVPLGALLHTVSIYREAKRASKFGLRTSAIGHNYPSLMSWKAAAIKRTGTGGSRRYYEKQGISVFAGTAHFLSPHEISVNRRHLSAHTFLVASGTQWRAPRIPGLTSVDYYTPATILSLTKPPKSLFIIGSGASAMELAHVFAAIGTVVHVAESDDHVLPEFDPEVGRALGDDAKHQPTLTLLSRTEVIAVQKEGLHNQVTYIRGGHQHVVKVDALLVASGRVSATDIGLENAGVAYDETGITIDTTLRTSAKHIFAVGGVTHPDMQTHAVLQQSRAAAHNILHRVPMVTDPHTPDLRVTFTNPQAAQVGPGEAACRRSGMHIRTATAPITLTSRSNITDQHTGFVKLISNKKRVIIGATIVAPHASDLISELALAIQAGVTAEQLVLTPHCFTAWSEAVRIAAGQLL